ncbi:unnamed protein product [Dicrocoelium dendriticum]|nr:unnamed protein product [Dicrocoelium dendriticum]
MGPTARVAVLGGGWVTGARGFSRGGGGGGGRGRGGLAGGGGGGGGRRRGGYGGGTGVGGVRGVAVGVTCMGGFRWGGSAGTPWGPGTCGGFGV